MKDRGLPIQGSGRFHSPWCESGSRHPGRAAQRALFGQRCLAPCAQWRHALGRDWRAGSQNRQGASQCCHSWGRKSSTRQLGECGARLHRRRRTSAHYQRFARGCRACWLPSATPCARTHRHHTRRSSLRPRSASWPVSKSVSSKWYKRQVYKCVNRGDSSSPLTMHAPYLYLYL